MTTRNFTSIEELAQWLIDENKKLNSRLMAQDFTIRTILGIMLRDGHIDKDEMNARLDDMAENSEEPARKDGWKEPQIAKFQENIRSYKLGATPSNPTFTVLDGGKKD